MAKLKKRDKPCSEGDDCCMTKPCQRKDEKDKGDKKKKKKDKKKKDKK
ncbi:MAG: hypothetical protein RBS99_14640 [Rhodospirillales bacterium]|jgi:hypothetical protein|nr:hypothetical protein [Rhodospirillales bacterium]